MKFIELKENEPLEVIEVTNHIAFFQFLHPITGEKDINSEIVVENKEIEMRIFTDGEIEKESKVTTKKIKEYYIGKKKYQHKVDTLKTKEIYFKNHSYVITYLIANEFMTVGNITGWFKVIKDVSVYLKNKKDRKALKSVKHVIREIEKSNNSIDYSNVFGMLFSRGNESKKIETKMLSPNVYSLKK